jgi:hypothetical protein
MMNWKGFVRNPSWPSFKVVSRHSPERTEDNAEDRNQGSQSCNSFRWLELRSECM